MATASTSERNARANDWAARYGNGILQIRNGTTVLAAHTLAGFAAASGGTVIANAIANVNITGAGTQTANNAKLIDGSDEYDLTLGLAGSGSDVIVTSTTYVNGQPSEITGFQVTFPAYR